MFQHTAVGLRLITASRIARVRGVGPGDNATQLSALEGFADNIIFGDAVSDGTRLLILAKTARYGCGIWEGMPLAVLPSFDDDLTTAARPPDGRYFHRQRQRLRSCLC